MGNSVKVARCMVFLGGRLLLLDRPLIRMTLYGDFFFSFSFSRKEILRGDYREFSVPRIFARCGLASGTDNEQSPQKKSKLHKASHSTTVSNGPSSAPDQTPYIQKFPNPHPPTHGIIVHSEAHTLTQCIGP